MSSVIRLRPPRWASQGGLETVTKHGLALCPGADEGSAIRSLKRTVCFFVFSVVSLAKCVTCVSVSGSEDYRLGSSPLSHVTRDAPVRMSSAIQDDDDTMVDAVMQVSDSHPMATSSVFLQDALQRVRGRLRWKKDKERERANSAEPAEPERKNDIVHQARPVMQQNRHGSEPDLVGLGRIERRRGPAPPTPPGRVPPIYAPVLGIVDPGRLKPLAQYGPGLKAREHVLGGGTPSPKATPFMPGRRKAPSPPPPSPSPPASPRLPVSRPVTPPPAQQPVSRPAAPPAVTPRRALGEGEWPTMEDIEPVPAEELLEGKKRVGEIVRQIQAGQSGGSSASFVQELSARLNRPAVRSTLEEELEENDGRSGSDVSSASLWDKDAVKTWAVVKKRRNPKRFVRPADVPPGVHVLRWLDEKGVDPGFYRELVLGREEQDDDTAASFVQSGRRWTPKKGFQLALQFFWPEGKLAEAVDETSRPHRFRMRNALGMGSFGAVVRVEDVTVRADDPNRFAAGKFMYQYVDPNTEGSQSLAMMKRMLRDELSIRDQMLAAMEETPEHRGKPLMAKLRHLIQSGLAAPQMTYEVRKTEIVKAVLGPMWDSSASETGSPAKQSLRFLTTMLTYPLIGPDLSELLEHRIDNAVRSYVVFKLVKVLANFQSLGFAHNDIKPANILARADGDLFLADVGLVVKLGQTFPCMNCTAIYLDPQTAECAFNDGMMKGSAKRDAWALGATLFSILCGDHLPYNAEHLWRRASKQVSRGENVVIPFLSLVSQVTRRNWSQNGCPRSITSLWYILKLLLDPEIETRKTALELSQHAFFKVSGV
ncbi:rhoptry kinase family protein rop28 [Cystoisospora suis]|uniref:Rhoptry kinase family protein rop28 n=1 Tax=Cystoisospora suis TaxID=483139 RepID=A0A2C6L100_9APIC|nr:rhoptry kinase family protein rop28 [Cystoisospora suis]